MISSFTRYSKLENVSRSTFISFSILGCIFQLTWFTNQEKFLVKMQQTKQWEEFGFLLYSEVPQVMFHVSCVLTLSVLLGVSMVEASKKDFNWQYSLLNMLWLADSQILVLLFLLKFFFGWHTSRTFQFDILHASQYLDVYLSELTNVHVCFKGLLIVCSAFDSLSSTHVLTSLLLFFKCFMWVTCM